MAALEDRVLTKIMRSGTLTDALLLGLKEEHFLNADSRMIFQALNRHWFNPETYGTLPTIQRIRARWPSFSLVTPNYEEEGNIKSLIYELKMACFGTDIRSLAEYFREIADEDPETTMIAMKSKLIEIDVRYSSGKEVKGAGLRDLLTMATTHYEDAQSGLIYGVPWPWKCLTDDTLGKRPGDFVVFYGRMKSMKTWLLLYCASVDYLDCNKRVLVWSKEMSRMKLGLRMATLLAKVDYQLFKKGLLPPRVRQRCFDILNALAKPNAESTQGERTRDLLLLAGTEAPRSIDGLKKAVDHFQPDVIYLDSFYHMESPRANATAKRWEKVSAIAEDVKAYAEDVQLPIIAAHQANRSGEKSQGDGLTDVADSDVIAREVDLIMRVLKSPNNVDLQEDEYEEEFVRLEKEAQLAVNPRAARLPSIRLGPKDPRLENQYLTTKLPELMDSKRKGAELAIVLNGNREGVLDSFIIKAVPSYNFELIDDRPSKESIKEWMKADDRADGAPKKKKVKPKTSDIDYAKAVANSGMK
jgi:replicative DNA helicase